MANRQTTLLAITPVLEERADDFEQWLRSVVHPAVREHQPELADSYTVLRATEAEDGAVAFTFLFHGGDPSNWELQPLLERALGAEGATRALSEMDGMLQREQYGWPVAPVPLDRPAEGSLPA
jgi:hypothetical protein